MGRYYEIIPVVSDHSTIFDAIDAVADAVGLYYWKVLMLMGFESDADLIGYCNGQTGSYFNRSAFITRQLNDICKRYDAPIRVIRPQVNIKGKEHK